MPSEKYAFKTTFRRPVRLLLFVLLLAALSAMLLLGLSIRNAVSGYLDDCEEYYHSVAELEYVGKDYPDAHAYDEELAAFLTEAPDFTDSLAALPGVIYFEPDSSELGIVSGVHRKDKYVDDKYAAVLVVKVTIYDERSDGFVGTISESPYSREDCVGKMVFLRRNGTEDYAKGETYVLSGRFIDGASSYLWFAPSDSELVLDGKTVFLPGCAVVEGELPQDSPYRRKAELLASRNNGFRVQKTVGLENLVPWQQEELTISEGRTFSEDEYRSDAPVCIVPERLLSLTALSVGDLMPISLNPSECGIYDNLSPETAPERTYRIIGSYADTVAVPDTIFLPVSEIASFSCPTGFSLGLFRLENSRAQEFMEAAEKLLPGSFSLKLYDQGYSVTSEPYKELYRIANLFLAVVSAAIAAVLLIYGYLCVLRRREEAMLQLALGSGKAFALRSFLCSSLLAASPSVPAGAFLARSFEEKALSLIETFVSRSGEEELRFSVSRVSLMRTLAFEPEPDSRLYLIGAVLLLAALFAVTAAFALVATAAPKEKKKRSSVRRVKEARPFRFYGRYRYSVLAILRGGMRTVSVLLLGCTVAILFCRLTATEGAYREQLSNIQEHSVIRGYVSDITGKELGGILITGDKVQRLFESGAADKLALTKEKTHCRVLGVSKTADGTPVELEEPYVPEDSFGRETLANQLAREHKWITTTSMELCPQLYYDAELRITWLEGYGEQSMSGPCAGLCVLPESMLEREHAVIGDTVRFLSYSTGRETAFFEMDLLCIGSYRVTSGSETVYTPFDYHFPVRENEECSAVAYDDVLYPYYGANYYTPSGRYLQSLTLNSAIFTLSETKRLDEARQILEDSGFTESGSVGRVRAYAVLDDWSYLSAVHGLERQIRYLNGLYGVLYVLTMLAGLAAAFLLMNSRQKELALMRALGTPPLRAAVTFLLEQLVLCGAGLGAGLWAWKRLETPPGEDAIRLAAVFFRLWILSTAAKLLLLVSRKAESLLKEPE